MNTPKFPSRDALIDRARLELMLSISPSLDPYVKHEAEVRLRLDAILQRNPDITSILFSDPFTDEGRYGCFDAFIYSGNSWAFVEIKERNYNSDKLDSWIVEDTKAAELEWMTSETGKPSYLATITSDDVALLWDIKSEHSKGERRCNWHTLNPEDGKRTKSFRFYPTNSAQVLR